MSRSRSRLAADWFAKLRVNSTTQAVEHTDVEVVDAATAAAIANIPPSNDASALTTGTLPDGRFPATLPAVDGSALTGIPTLFSLHPGVIGGRSASFNVINGISTDADDTLVVKVFLGSALVSTTTLTGTDAQGDKVVDVTGLTNETSYTAQAFLSKTIDSTTVQIGESALISFSTIGIPTDLAHRLGDYNSSNYTVSGMQVTTSQSGCHVGNCGNYGTHKALGAGSSVSEDGGNEKYFRINFSKTIYVGTVEFSLYNNGITYYGVEGYTIINGAPSGTLSIPVNDYVSSVKIVVMGNRVHIYDIQILSEAL